MITDLPEDLPVLRKINLQKLCSSDIWFVCFCIRFWKCSEHAVATLTCMLALKITIIITIICFAHITVLISGPPKQMCLSSIAVISPLRNFTSTSWSKHQLWLRPCRRWRTEWDSWLWLARAQQKVRWPRPWGEGSPGQFWDRTFSCCYPEQHVCIGQFEKSADQRWQPSQPRPRESEKSFVLPTEGDEPGCTKNQKNRGQWCKVWSVVCQGLCSPW